MTTSLTSILSKPTGSEKIPAGTLSYMRTRFQRRIHSLILSEFANSELSQADLARRLGKGPDLVCRWLAAPANCRLNTLSDLLFAINGGELVDDMRYPLEQAARNDSLPDWLSDAIESPTPSIGAHPAEKQVYKETPPDSFTTSKQDAIVNFTPSIAP